MGLSAVWAGARRRPTMLIAIDRVASRLEIALEFGATHTIDASKEDVDSVLFKMTDAVGVTHTFDTAASPVVGSGAIESSAKRGKVVICGVASP
ncbi:zinc-binding dehydrogenase [Paeniglutamicibacter sp. NPDC091659]|uniref:zinc-binding dehydrogenase n=1 Tax=Paeniglutamicibacter sp. NPDC091659 TaxID=3364389 RepID=UPI003820FBC1